MDSRDLGYVIAQSLNLCLKFVEIVWSERCCHFNPSSPGTHLSSQLVAHYLVYPEAIRFLCLKSVPITSR